VKLPQHNVDAWQGNCPCLACHSKRIEEQMPKLDETLSSDRAAGQARQVIRDLVIAAGDLTSRVQAAKSDRLGLAESELRHDLWAAAEKAASALEDLAVEALVAAGREHETEASFEAGAAFDLFWPEDQPPPAVASGAGIASAPGDTAEGLKQRIQRFMLPDKFATATDLHKFGMGLIFDMAAALGLHKKFPCVPRPGEPSFWLLGRDPAADGLIDIWCEARRMLIALNLKPKSDMAKVIEAHNIGERMREYRRIAASVRPASSEPAADDGSAAHGHEHPQPD
jgi:hypothetical protein